MALSTTTTRCFRIPTPPACDFEFPVLDAFRSCSLSGSAQAAISMLKSLTQPSTPLQNTILRHLCNHGLFHLALHVHHICRISGSRSDHYTFPSVLKASSSLGDILSGTQAHSSLLKTAIDRNTVVMTALLHFYGKIGRVDTARLLLYSIQHPDTVSWNAIISIYSSEFNLYMAMDSFREMCFTGSYPTVSTLASLLPLSTQHSRLDLGQSLHGLALKSGLLFDGILTPALISMYSKSGFLSTSSALFDSSDQTDVPAWNAVISASVLNHEPAMAVLMFRRMLRLNHRPNALTFVAVIPSDDGSGEALHSLSIKLGFVDRVSVATALISMYGKCGDISSSSSIFGGMPETERNILSWNSMGSACFRAGFREAGFSLLREMQSSGFTPDTVSLIMVLPACTDSGYKLLGKSAHGFGIRRGLDSYVNFSNALLSFYSIHGRLDTCFHLFCKTQNVVSWNTMISRLIADGDFSEAISMLRKMRREAVEMDWVTLMAVLPACDFYGDLLPGDGVHGHALKAGFGSDTALSNAFVCTYGNSGNFPAAEKLFHGMAERDSLSWNSLLTVYSRYSMDKEAATLFWSMCRELKPGYVTLLNVLPVCRTRFQGGSVHAYSLRTGAMAETKLVTALMVMYARFGGLDSCLVLFCGGDGRSVSLWNAMMAAFVFSGEALKSVKLFSEMVLAGAASPDHVTVLSLVSAIGEVAGGVAGGSVMGFVLKAGYGRDVEICNSVMDMYARGGDVVAAREVFDGMPERDSVSWGVMIGRYGSHGDGAAAVGLLARMRRLQVECDSVTYLGVLSACSHAGLVEESRSVFGWLVADGIEPSVEHYACMVDLLGRCGRVEEAHRLVRRLPDVDRPRLMNSVLAACGAHGNAAELGHKVGKYLLEHDAENPRVYIMLYRIYAAAGRWEDAERIRGCMDRRGLRKLPGFSLVGSRMNM